MASQHFRGGSSFNLSSSSDNTINLSPITDEGCLFQWLSPLDPQLRHQDLRDSRLDGVGGWFLETVEFRKWRSSGDGNDSAVLFCWGDFGAGKSYLNSLVIDTLRSQAQTNDIAVAGIYCDFRDQVEQSTLNILGAILEQLLGEREIPEYVLQAFQSAERESGNSRCLQLPDLEGMLKATIALLPRVFICVDALDGLHSEHLSKLLTSLKDIARESPNTRIFLTGRAHVMGAIEENFPRAAVVSVSSTDADIERYLEMELERDLESGAMDDDLRADILSLIPETFSPILLLVSLAIRAILEQPTISLRRKILCAMIRGEDLDDAYTPTLERIKAQKGSESELGMEALMWVSHSERPLHVNELCHALGIVRGSADLDTGNIPAIEAVLGCALGFITVEALSSTVHLVHPTLQVYLSYNPTLFPCPDSMISEACLTYLNFREIRDLSPTLFSAPPTTPFVEYASHYWGTHARRETTDRAIPLALRLLDGYDNHISSKLLLLRDKEDGLGRPFNEDGGPMGFTGLHVAACFGAAKILTALLEHNKWDLNAIDYEGSTALAWAAGKGCDEALMILLGQRNVNPNTANKYGQVPLSLATKEGHERAVKLLLREGDVGLNSSDSNGRTPLSWAAYEGHERVVKLLLKHDDTNPNSPDRDGRTPLSWAAREGHEGVVKLLLERRGVDPGSPDRDGQTPLSLAAANGHERIVQMLLESKNFDPNLSIRLGQAPPPARIEHGDSLQQQVFKKPSRMPIDEHIPKSPEPHEKLPPSTVKSQEPDEPPLPLPESLATRLVNSCLCAPVSSRGLAQCRHLGRFRLWADEYDTPHGQLDKILQESPILRETTMILLADLSNILTTRTSHSDGTLRKEHQPVLREVCATYPEISQLFPDNSSDSGGEEDEIEAIVDSLFNLSPLLVDILENLPGDSPTGVGSDDKATAALEVQGFDGSGYVLLPLVLLLLSLLVHCLMLLYPTASHTELFQMVLKNLRLA